MTQWYYESMGQIVGPLSPNELLRKVRAGDISENTRLRKDDSQWVNAGEVNGLFEAAKRATVQYKCPYCGGQIDKPPTVCLQCDREINAAYRIRDKAPPPDSANHSADTTGKNDPANGEGTIVNSVLSWLKTLGR